MAIRFDHTIVHSHDARAAAAWLADVLGRPAARRFGPFHVVDLDDGVSLDFLDAGDTPFLVEHYAFLVDEADFDAVFARLRARGVRYWADPACERPGEINRNDGGRGVYFASPDDHLFELITRKYGSGV